MVPLFVIWVYINLFISLNKCLMTKTSIMFCGTRRLIFANPYQIKLLQNIQNKEISWSLSVSTMLYSLQSSFSQILANWHHLYCKHCILLKRDNYFLEHVWSPMLITFFMLIGYKTHKIFDNHLMLVSFKGILWDFFNFTLEQIIEGRSEAKATIMF